MFPQARRRRAFSAENKGFGVSANVTPSWNRVFPCAFEVWPGEAEKQEKLAPAASLPRLRKQRPPPLGGAIKLLPRVFASVRYVCKCMQKIRGRPEFRIVRRLARRLVSKLASNQSTNHAIKQLSKQATVAHTEEEKFWGCTF